MDANSVQIPRRYLALCGGVGGTKLALGLSHILPPEQLSIIVNTGDDFDHLGLRICPDIDTVTYTLAGLVHQDQGWGRANETFSAMQTVAALGGDTWFRLGDRDLGLHLMRRTLLKQGLSLSAVTAHIAKQLGVRHEIAPMSDEPIPTLVDTSEGRMPFQHYFVRRACAPIVSGIEYHGATAAQPSPALSRALADPQLGGIFICPSNPYLSIDPILAVAGVRQMLARSTAPIVAVSPLVGGKAVKGPTAKIMRELGIKPSAAAVAAHYGELLDGYLIDAEDDTFAATAKVAATNILMNSLHEKVALARRCLALAQELEQTS